MTMFKNSNTLVLKTTNSPFEELYSLLTYKSSTAVTGPMVLTFPSDIPGTVMYSGVIMSKVPLADRIGAPCEIQIPIKGYVSADGNSTTIISIPSQYKDYVQAIETIQIRPDGNIKVHLGYTIHAAGSESTDNLFTTAFYSMKSMAYNSIINTVESHIIELYNNKRKLCFCRNPVCRIDSLDGFLEHIGVKTKA